jgi:glyoxylase-like metal-dependent hydrolase (beta-lactamase superfamily II)
MLEFLASLILGSLGLAGGDPPPAPRYEVYAVRYATLLGFPKSALVLGADSTKLDLAMMVWVVKGEGRTLLVDAGFYRDEFRKAWKTDGYLTPAEAVKKLGIEPGAVTDIVISHMHWDHADGADLFPKAKVWVQREEFEFYRDPANQSKTGVFPSDVQMFQKIEQDGRLGLVNGDSVSVAPGILFYIGGRHTKQSQYVSVPTAKGTVVIASDNLYLYDNLDRRRPIAATWDTVSNLKAQDRMKRLASSARLIVPGHDPAVFTRFPTVVPGVVAIK